MDIKNLTIKKFHQGLINREFSVVETTRAFFDYIEKKDREIRSYG